VNQLRRFISWVLSGLAVGVALRALTGRRAGGEPAPPDSSSPTSTGADPVGFASPFEAAPDVDADWQQPSDRWQTAMAVGRVLSQRLRAHTTTVVAGSLAYYALLSLFPAAIAAISIYGLIADPADLTNLIKTLTERLPDASATLISDELTKIVTSNEAGLGLATGLGIVVALWSASAGAKVLITGVNLAYGERETRSYIVVRGLALLLTLATVVGVVVVVSGVAILPRIVDSSLTDVARWPALIVLAVVGLAALYRIAPSDAPGRNHPIWQGAFAAAVVWLAATAVFSAAVTAFGRFNATYGALAGVVVLLIWFFLSGLIVLLGAELNAAIETRRQRLAIATG